MQIKTFCAGRGRGNIRALQSLDEQVAEDLGHNTTIHSVTDTMYGDSTTSRPNDFIVARVVVFSQLA